MSRGHLGLWLDSRGCKTTSRAGGLQAPLQLCWDTWGNRDETWLQRNSRGREDVRISSIPAIMCLAPPVVTLLPCEGLERQPQLFTQSGAILGRDGALHLAITLQAPPLPSTLLCQGGGKCSSSLVFLPSHKSFLETTTSVLTTRDHVSSITHLLSEFWGKTVSKTTSIQALLSLTLCYSSLSAGSVSAFMFRLYAINCIMANSSFESLTD